MAVTVQDIINYANRINFTIPANQLANLNSILATIDQNAMLQQEKAKYNYVIWDKKTPINGIDASVVLARHDVNRNSEIYLIQDATTGQTIYLQPHAPNQAGNIWMDSTTVHTFAGNHLNDIAQLNADAKVILQALKNLGFTG